MNVTLDAHQSISIARSAWGDNCSPERKRQRELFLRPARPVADAYVHGPRIREHHAAPERGRQRAEHGARHQAEPKAWVLRKRFRPEQRRVQPDEHPDRSRGHAGRCRPDPELVNGGILANVNQDSTGVNTANATQTETQCEDANGAGGPLTCDTTADPPGYSLTQTQFGPFKKGDGDSDQTGDNPASTFTINQSSTQDNDTGENQTNLVQGDCATSGNCKVTQATNINGTSHTNTQSGQTVDTQITCSGSTCTSSGPTTTGGMTLRPDGCRWRTLTSPSSALAVCVASGPGRSPSAV